MAPPPPSTFRLPRLYTLFFLTLSPLATLAATLLAHSPATYLSLISPSPAALSPATSTALHQLANLYLLRALAEALVLRATADRSVWRALLFCLLVADAGHLWALRHTVGAAGYVCFWEWSAFDWGNLGFVYVAAALRVAFLAGVGMGRGAAAGKGKGGAAVAKTAAAAKAGVETEDEKTI